MKFKREKRVYRACKQEDDRPPVNRSITYDVSGKGTPRPGEYLRTIDRRSGKTRSIYLIVLVTRVHQRDRKTDVRRFKLIVQRQGSSVGTAPAWWMQWNSRESK